MTHDVTITGAQLILRTSEPLGLPAVGSTTPGESTSWRERLWTCHPETRLGVEELCEALGRSKAFVYRHTRAKSIPHRRLDGELVFVAGEIRAWLNDQEETVVTRRALVSPIRAAR